MSLEQLPSELQSLSAHLDRRLDRIEGKLDTHLDRISAAETNIDWLRGHAKVTVSLAIALAGSLAGALYKLFLAR